MEIKQLQCLDLLCRKTYWYISTFTQPPVYFIKHFGVGITIFPGTQASVGMVRIFMNQMIRGLSVCLWIADVLSPCIQITFSNRLRVKRNTLFIFHHIITILNSASNWALIWSLGTDGTPFNLIFQLRNVDRTVMTWAHMLNILRCGDLLPSKDFDETLGSRKLSLH
jgi:hypothetical protein